MMFQKEYNHFANYYSQFTDVISIINRDGYLVYINFIVNGKIEDLIGLHINTLNESENQELNNKLLKLFETGKSFTSEYEVSFQGVNTKFISNNFKLSLPDLGDFVVSMTRELNNTKVQNDSETKFDLLLQNQDFLVIRFKLIDNKFIITYANEFTYNTLHNNINSNLIGIDLNSFFYEIDKEFIYNHLNNIENSHQTYIRLINGDIFKSDIIISICNDENKLKIDNLIKNGFANDTEIEFQIIAQDTNLRKQLKFELIKSHNQLSEIILNLGKLICIINDENQIIYANNLFYEFFEIQLENLKNFDLFAYLESNFKLTLYYKNNNGLYYKSSIKSNYTQEIYEYELPDSYELIKHIDVKVQKVNFGEQSNCKLILINDISTAKLNYLGYKEKNRFKELMDSMPLMIHSLNKNNEIIEVSQFWLTKLGYSYEEVIGKHTYDFMTEESRRFALSDIVPKYFEKDSISNIPYTFVTKSGDLIDVLMTVVILKDEFNNKRSLSISFDITDKNNLLKQIQSNEKLLSTIFENAPYGIELLNTSGDKIKVNKKTLDIADHFEIEMKYLAAENELIASMGIFPNFIEAVNGKEQLIKNLHIDFGPFSKKKGKVPKEDLIGVYDMYLNPIINSDNKVENVICFLDDITQEIKYQNQLEFQSLILQNINDIVVALDENMNIIYWNTMAEITYGYSAKETLGKRIEEFYSYRWIDSNDTQKSLKSVREKGYWKGEIIHITKDGKELYIETNTTNIIDSEGNFKGILAVNRDISNRKNQEIELIRNNKLIDAIFDNSPTAIQIYDSKGYSVRFNEAQRKFAGLGDLYSGIGEYNILKDEFLKSTEILSEFLKAFSGKRVEVKGLRINFSIYGNEWGVHSNKRYIDITILPIFDENEKINSVVSFITDITDRYENEQKLKESEAQYRLLTENTTDLIINYNSDGIIIYVSPSIVNVLGFEAEDLLNTQYAYWFSGKNLTKLGSKFGKNFILGNEVANVEYKVKNKQGVDVYLDTLIKPILNELGELIDVITYSRDITDRIIHEAKLKDANRLMSEMSEIANIGGWEVDVETGAITWTKQVFLIHGLVLGNPPANLEEAVVFYSDQDKEKIISAFDKTINESLPFDLVLELIPKNNNNKWVRATGYPFYENGKLTKIYGSFQDISDNYLKDQKIRENENLLKSINTNINESLWRAVEDDGVIYANQAAFNMFQFENLEEMRSYGLGFVYAEDNKRKELVNLLAKKGSFSNEEVIFKRKDGSKFWGLMSTFQSINDNGKIVYDGAIIDITDRKEKEEMLSHLNQNLERMVEERTNELRLTQEKLLESFIQEKEYLELKSKFITLVSHEYRTPLTIIQTSLYLLETFYEKRRTEQFQNQIARINDAIESMTVLLDNVLTLNTYDLNAVRKYIQEINFVQLVNEIIEMQLQISKETYNFQIDSKINKIIMFTDKTMVYQVLNNLVENAIKFSNSNKTIEITIDLIEKEELTIKNHSDFETKYVRFIILDYGIGISKENLIKLAEPFFRGDNVQEIRGLGLGLSISHTWVKILEGNLIFESELGQFTKVTLELPLAYQKGNS